MAHSSEIPKEKQVVHCISTKTDTERTKERTDTFSGRQSDWGRHYALVSGPTENKELWFGRGKGVLGSSGRSNLLTLCYCCVPYMPHRGRVAPSQDDTLRDLERKSAHKCSYWRLCVHFGRSQRTATEQLPRSYCVLVHLLVGQRLRMRIK